MAGAYGPAWEIGVLIESLERAEGDDRRLDHRIAECLGTIDHDLPPPAALLLREEFSTDVATLLQALTPAYTASLDARIPGENIVLTIRSDARGRWAAVHRSANGSEATAWAATECLARRAAALKAWQEALAVVGERRGSGTRAALSRAADGAEPAAEPRPAPQGDAEHGVRPGEPWRVRPPSEGDESWTIKF